MHVTLGINTGFAINRFPEPDDWTGIIADDLGLETVQFTADLLNPFLPPDLVAVQADRIAGLCADRGIRVETTFTSAFTRVNHLTHPDPAMQQVWIDWFKRFFDLSRRLGAEGAGSHFGILSVRDSVDPAVRAQRLEEGVRNWRELSEHAAAIGLSYMIFEPMSVPREFGETIAATEDLLARCADGFAVPMRLCLDVDHGDLASPDPRDTDAHAWIRALGREAPCIHIKQSLRDKGGHYPFTPGYNARGKIVPEEVLATMAEAGIARCTLLLEISHRERWPTDLAVVDDLKASVAYWRPAVDAWNARDAAPGM